jgi:hypothetical protein
MSVRNYTDKQLLDRAKSLPKYKSIPTTYWILCVRSDEDANDVFDDKVYLFCGEKFIMVSPCTTNKGNKGTGVVCADVWYWKPGKREMSAFSASKFTLPGVWSSRFIPLYLRGEKTPGL